MGSNKKPRGVQLHLLATLNVKKNTIFGCLVSEPVSNLHAHLLIFVPEFHKASRGFRRFGRRKSKGKGKGRMPGRGLLGTGKGGPAGAYPSSAYPSGAFGSESWHHEDPYSYYKGKGGEEPQGS